MTKLVYPDNVSTTIKYKTGTTREVTVYYPMGPRQAPGLAAPRGKGKTALTVAQKAVNYFKRYPNNTMGFSSWELALALNVPTSSVRTALDYHPELFKQDKELTHREYTIKGKIYNKGAYRWHLITQS
jgi:hypothetical protein